MPMYLEHFGLSEAPFRITPHTDFFFAGANRGATLDALLYAATHDEGIVKVTGEVGSGKTMLCRVLLERLPPSVESVYFANPSLSREEILFALADELKVNLATQRAGAAMRAIQDHLIAHFSEGRQVVVIIDEAHAMPAETLEEIRLLSNLETNRHKLLQLVLFGQPELDATLSKPEMRQLKERITHNFVLEPLVRADVASYIDFRIRAAGHKGPDLFSDPAIRLIARGSLGMTRRINILADKSLLAAFAEHSRQVQPKHVKRAIQDSDFRNPRRPGAYVGVLSALTGAVLTAVVLFFAQHRTDGPVPPATPSLPSSPGGGNGAGPAAPDGIASVPVAAAAGANPHTDPPAPAISAPAVIDASAKTPSATEEDLGPLTRERLAQTRAWLAAAGPDRWFIQLLATSRAQAAQVESFLAEASKATDLSKVHVYLADLPNSRRVGVIYGDFASRASAAAALKDLPPIFKASGPYVRPTNQLPR